MAVIHTYILIFINTYLFTLQPFELYVLYKYEEKNILMQFPL